MAETLRSTLQRLANAVLRPGGLHLERADRATDLAGLLRRAQARGLAPATIIDVGASDGVWSLRARRHFPRARYLLLEPLAERAPALVRLHRRYGFEHVAAAAGDHTGPVPFAVSPDLDGSGLAATGAAAARTVPMVRIDEVTAARGLNGPYLLKLDTHGFEVPILDGATHVLAHTQLLLVEAYNFRLSEGSLRFHELCRWLEARGLRCCDLAEPMRRPGDGVLWQLDLAFAPADSAFFRSDAYA